MSSRKPATETSQMINFLNEISNDPCNIKAKDIEKVFKFQNFSQYGNFKISSLTGNFDYLIFQGLDPYERMTLADALVTRVYEDGESIIEQGDTADGMYFVEEGVIRVTITSNDGREQELSGKGTTTYFGELALINNKPRTANVYAVGRVKVAFLERSCFERLLGPCVEIMKRNSELYTMYVDDQ